MFLTKDELKEMSGGKRPSSVCRWLDSQRIRYAVGRDKWPRVLRSVVLVHFGDIEQVSSRNEPQLHL